MHRRGQRAQPRRPPSHEARARGERRPEPPRPARARATPWPSCASATRTVQVPVTSAATDSRTAARRGQVRAGGQAACIAAIIAVGRQARGGTSSCPGRLLRVLQRGERGARCPRQDGREVQAHGLLDRAGARAHKLLELAVALRAPRAQRAQAHAPVAPRRRVHARVQPREAHRDACMHTRTEPSDSLTAACSVDSQPRLPALVARARMASSGATTWCSTRRRGALVQRRRR